MAESKDIEITIIEIKEAQKQRYFGDITISFRAGVVQYVRKNKIQTIDELINSKKGLDKKG